MTSAMATLTLDPPHRFVLKLVTNALHKHHETKSAPHRFALQTTLRLFGLGPSNSMIFCTPSFIFSSSFQQKKCRCLKDGTSGIGLSYHMLRETLWNTWHPFPSTTEHVTQNANNFAGPYAEHSWGLSPLSPQQEKTSRQTQL